jgi:Periplasmic binding protein
MKLQSVVCLLASFALLLAGTAEAQIKIGIAAPITGANAALGAQIKNGGAQAIEEINASGGSLGRKILLYLGDDRADPKEGVSVANLFAANGVKFVIGHSNSGVTIPATTSGLLLSDVSIEAVEPCLLHCENLDRQQRIGRVECTERPDREALLASSTSRPSTGTICARQTRSKAYSLRSVNREILASVSYLTLRKRRLRINTHWDVQCSQTANYRSVINGSVDSTHADLNRSASGRQREGIT